MTKSEEIIETDQVAEAPIRMIKPLKANDLTIAESKRITHHVTLPCGIALEDLTIPDFWSEAAPKLHRRDLIEVEPEDGAWWALLLVREVGVEHAKLAVLQKIDFPSSQASVDDLPLGHTVQFLGPKRRWAAMRNTQILRPGFTTKGEAVSWLNETLRA